MSTPNILKTREEKLAILKRNGYAPEQADVGPETFADVCAAIDKMLPDEPEANVSTTPTV